MFGVSYQELILIMVVVLVVFGPKRLPELARGLAQLMNSLRTASNDLRRTIMAELDDGPRRPYTPPQPARPYDDLYPAPSVPTAGDDRSEPAPRTPSDAHTVPPLEERRED